MDRWGLNSKWSDMSVMIKDFSGTLSLNSNIRILHALEGVKRGMDSTFA